MEQVSEHFPSITDEFLRQELSDAFVRVWEAMIGLPIEPIEVDAAMQNVQSWTSAVVWLGGSWTGNVEIGLPYKLGEALVSHLLHVEQPSRREVEDVIRELANMTAGNLKTVLPGKSSLAIPGSFQGVASQGGEDAFKRILVKWFKAYGYVICISLSALHENEVAIL